MSHATVPRSCPPADVFVSVTLYGLALDGSATHATAWLSSTELVAEPPTLATVACTAGAPAGVALAA